MPEYKIQRYELHVMTRRVMANPRTSRYLKSEEPLAYAKSSRPTAKC